MSVHCDKIFPWVSTNLTLWPWPWCLTYLLNLALPEKNGHVQLLWMFAVTFNMWLMVYSNCCLIYFLRIYHSYGDVSDTGKGIHKKRTVIKFSHAYSDVNDLFLHCIAWSHVIDIFRRLKKSDLYITISIYKPVALQNCQEKMPHIILNPIPPTHPPFLQYFHILYACPD